MKSLLLFCLLTLTSFAAQEVHSFQGNDFTVINNKLAQGYKVVSCYGIYDTSFGGNLHVFVLELSPEAIAQLQEIEKQRVERKRVEFEARRKAFLEEQARRRVEKTP